MGDFVDVAGMGKMTLEPTAKVVKKDVYAKYIKAEKLVNNALDEAKRIRKLSSANYKKQKLSAMTEGMEQAQAELDKKLVDLSNKAIGNLKDIERSIVEIVSSCVKTIIGDIDNEHLIANIVAQKITHLQQSKSLTITVNPANDMQLIQHYLVNHLGIDSFSLKADGFLQEDQLIIDAALGSINTTIEREVLMVIDEIKESCLPKSEAMR